MSGPNSTSTRQSEPSLAMERRNRLLFVASNLLIYFSAPVTYVGVLHVGLLDALGLSATIANLPESAFLVGFLVPLLLTQRPIRWSPQSIVFGAYGSLGITHVLVGALLLLPVQPVMAVVVLVLQGFAVGASLSTGQIFMLRCLKAGTRPGGVASAFKIAFSAGPVTAVVGSLCSQWILTSQSPALAFPYNYAALFFLSTPFLMALALVGRMYQLPPEIPGQETPPQPQIWRRLRDYFSCRPLATAWLVYFLYYLGMHAMANTSLFARTALDRPPSEFSGWIMALRFGAKSIFGYALGRAAERFGPLMAVRVILVILGVAMAWVSLVPGYLFLATFALLGGAELGGIYFSGYVLAISASGTEPKNLAVLTLATAAAAGLPALHGALTDTIGFHASFICACVAAVSALLLTRVLPSGAPAPSKGSQ